jgi:hypothetical protein
MSENSLAEILENLRERIAQLHSEMQQQINDLKERMSALEKKRR